MYKIYTVLIILLLTHNFFSQTWHKTDQPEGGNIRSIDCSPLDSNQIVILVSRFMENLICYSSDAGNSWIEIGKIENSLLPGKVKIDPINNRIYIASYALVQVTTNLGVTWKPVFQKSGYIYDLQYNPDDPSELLFTHHDGIYRSSDFGEIWILVNPATNSYVNDIRYSLRNSNIVLVEGSSNMFLSTDGGLNWNIIWIPNAASYESVVFDPLEDNVLYAMYHSQPWDSVFTQKSTDLGITWNIINDNYRSFKLCYAENNQAVFVFVDEKGVYKSTDYCLSWQLFSPLLSCNYIMYNGAKLYACFPSKGFAKHITESIWSFPNKNLTAWEPNVFFITDSLKIFSTYDNVYWKTTVSSVWESTHPDTGFTSIDFYNSKIGFASFYYSIFKTTDGGTNWYPFTAPGFPRKIKDIKVIGEYIFAAIGNSYDGIYRSPVSQASWTKIVDGYNSRIMYDGTCLYAFAKEWNGPLIFGKSSDYGYHWYVVDTLSQTTDYVAFAKKDNPPGILLGGFNKSAPPIVNYPGILYFIKENGEKTTLLTGDGIYSVAAPKGRKEFYVMKYAQGTLLKADSIGGAFYPVEEGLPYIIDGEGGTSLFYFDIPSYENKLFTNRGGLMELDLGSLITTTEHNGDLNDLQFELNQNYPNPFNPSTTIEFSVKKSAFVSLKVYNILGREIAVLVNEEKSKGLYAVKFNAQGQASGVYFYQLRIDGKSYMKNMLLLK